MTVASVVCRVASPDFVGREPELAQAVGALARARDGEPAVALIGGESGVGKSRLVAELIARAHASGTRVLAGDCVALGDTELPYAPIVAALRGLDRDEIEAIVGRAAAGLAPLLPQLGEGDGTATSGALAQGRLFEALLALLGGLADDGEPLLLVIEDLHWADRSTRDFLAFLIRTARRERIALIATYRTDELHRRHPLRPFLAEAERAPAVTRVAVQRFTREELRAQLEGILGRRPEARLADDLFARAEGNPFYTEELLAAGDQLPENVRDTLMMRIEALSPETQAVLRMAATAGPRVRHGLLVRVLELPSETLLAALREAVVHHVLVHDPATDAYAFRHALQREAISDDLLPGERGPLHGSLATALAEDPSLSASGGVAAELAFHWAAAFNLPAAFAAFCEAGEEATRLAAFPEANAHFERAAELFDAVPAEQRATTRVELLQRAAESAYFAANNDRAAALIRRALAEVDSVREPMTAALLHERLGRYLWTIGMSGDALDTLRTAVTLLRAEGAATDRARVLGTEAQLLMLAGRPAEAAARCEQALPLARAAGACAEAAGILNTLGATNAMQGRFDEAIACIREARDIAEEVRDLEELSRSYVNLGQTLDASGHVEAAAEIAREGVAMCEREGVAGVGALLVSELAGRLVRLGRWDEAGRLTDDLLDRSLTGVHRGAALAARGHLDGLQGLAGPARTSLDEAERMQRQTAGAMWTAPVAIGRAEAALWAGDPREAARVIHAELATYTAQDDDPLFVPPVLTLGARAEADLAAAGDATAADRAAGLLRRMRCLLGVTGSAAAPETVLHGAWTAAEAERAAGIGRPGAWADLAARWNAFGAPYPAAYARWREAQAELAAGGDRERVKSALTAVRDVARRLGAVPLHTEAETLAHRARIALGTAPTAGGPGTADRLGLTDRELAVLHRLAAGESNREIGKSLFISHKTVSVHVSRILSKLDARTRAEAASIGQRLGLLA